MSDGPEFELPPRRILPRNLTARADYVVPGNPMIARPESGVGNAHPGLEFDVRALDRHFLPGLVFDFQYGVGAKLVDLGAPHCSLTKEDLKQGLFLWAVRGSFGDKPNERQVVCLIGVDGYMVLRRIMDLEAGPITVVVGPLPTTPAHRSKIAEIVTALQEGNTIPSEERESDGRSVVYACVEGRRADYLTPDGVIDPALLPAGEITRNLCSPWQWDFAECYCYYWASSKPDIVIGISGGAQVLNFQRDRDAPEPARPPADVKTWREDNMRGPAMITDWEKLPVVTREREGAVPRLSRWPSIDRPMSLREIAGQLPELARLEHALCVEYLFARYSIDAPRKARFSTRGSRLRRYQAAREIFSIAQDEMRHFRWVNEAMWLLDREPCVGRATVIGRDQRRSFQLRPLMPSTLDEFIGIEAPSSVFDDDPQQLNGMYTRILVSLHHLECKAGADRDLLRRLKQLVKVIIDEGDNHWDRFQRVKAHLAGEKPESYLRFTTSPGEAKPGNARALQELCDAYYDILLHALYITFRLGRRSRGFWLSLARNAMRALDEAAYHLAEAGYGPLFTLADTSECPVPRAFADQPAGPRAAATTPRKINDLVRNEDAIGKIFEPALTLIGHLATTPRRRLRGMAIEHRRQLTEMRALMIRAYKGDLATG